MNVLITDHGLVLPLAALKGPHRNGWAQNGPNGGRENEPRELTVKGHQSKCATYQCKGCRRNGKQAPIVRVVLLSAQAPGNCREVHNTNCPDQEDQKISPARAEPIVADILGIHRIPVYPTMKRDGRSGRSMVAMRMTMEMLHCAGKAIAHVGVGSSVGVRGFRLRKSLPQSLSQILVD